MYANHTPFSMSELKVLNLFLDLNKHYFAEISRKTRLTRPMPGFGTKHAAASGFTRKFKDSTAVLVDENIDWIKIFQNGKIILELDSEERPSSIKKKIIDFIADHDMTLLTTAGVSAALFGITPVLVLSGTYMFIKTATGIIRKSLKRL